ncbi:MAG: hypothetical protein WBC50_10265 [Dehalococcoidales bacterium]
MDALWTIKLIELVLLYGPDIALKMVSGLNAENVTLEMIEGLLVDPPESYFKDKEEPE